MYYTYITTNPSRTVLYTGMTNDLKDRIQKHYESRGNPKTFAGKYYCYNLVFFNEFTLVNDAIAREKQIKGLSRAKKLALIKSVNPGMRFLMTPDKEE